MAGKNDRPQVEPWTADLYSTIENWWGEEVNARLAERASATSPRKLRAFLEAIASPDLMNYSPALPSMARGTLRPLVSGHPIELEPSDSVGVALRLLLYVHDVALESDFIGPILWLARKPVDDEARAQVRDILGKLGDLRPFIAQGIVHLTPVRSPALHPSGGMWDYTAIQNPEVRKVAHQLLVENETFFDGEEITDGLLARALPYFLGATKMALLRMSEGKANPLTRTAAERAIVNALLARGEIPDRRRPLVDSLARLRVPDFRDDPKLLVSLRKSEETFDVWRQKLGDALTQLGDMPDTANLSDASAIVRTELQSALSGIERSTKSSPVLRSAREGFVQFGVSAIGVASTASVTHDPMTTGLVGVVSTQLANSVVGYLKELRAKRPDRLVLALAASFDASG